MNLFKQLAVVAAIASSIGAASAATSFGDGGAALQGVLNSITVPPPSSVNVVTDQYGLDEVWQIGGSGGSLSTFIIQLASLSSTHRFGIYDATDSSKKVELMAGTLSAGTQALVSILADGSVIRNFVDTGINFAGNAFGYYLTAGSFTFYSQAGLNGDLDSDGQADDHMVAYQGTGDTIQIGAFAPGPWANNEFIIAFEDLPFTGSDRDYTDFVALVESVSGIPEPGTLGLLGLSLAGLGLMTRRRRAQ